MYLCFCWHPVIHINLWHQVTTVLSSHSLMTSEKVTSSSVWQAELCQSHLFSECDISSYNFNHGWWLLNWGFNLLSSLKSQKGLWIKTLKLNLSDGSKVCTCHNKTKKKTMQKHRKDAKTCKSSCLTILNVVNGRGLKFLFMNFSLGA